MEMKAWIRLVEGILDKSAMVNRGSLRLRALKPNSCIPVNGIKKLLLMKALCLKLALTGWVDLFVNWKESWRTFIPSQCCMRSLQTRECFTVRRKLQQHIWLALNETTKLQSALCGYKSRTSVLMSLSIGALSGFASVLVMGREAVHGKRDRNPSYIHRNTLKGDWILQNMNM